MSSGKLLRGGREDCNRRPKADVVDSVAPPMGSGGEAVVSAVVGVSWWWLCTIGLA